ncbi:alginate export family protein [Sphingomonas parva]|uniref:alginate export family protein n=1 Tax=Sphingomonas parva TaxID=2555898 RepID=UPI001CDBBCAC|nr:alginate export family protein [Sphingomonas parva]
MRKACLVAAVSGLACFLSHAPAAAAPLQDAIGAGDAWRIKASVRSRTEAIDGQFRPGAPESDFLQSFRSTLLAEYDAGPLRIGAEVTDSRGYGQKRNSSAGTSDINPVELTQAYVALELGDAFAEGSSALLTAGRFTLPIGSKRLLDAAGSSNRIPAYTGVNLDWKSAGGDRLVAFWAMPHLREPDDVESLLDNEVQWDPETTDLQFSGASFTKAKVLGGSVEVYAYALKEKDSAERPTTNRRLFTPGFRIFRAPAAAMLDYELEAAYQFGAVRASKAATDTRDLDVSAWFIHAEAGRTFTGAWKPRLSFLFDQASGDKANAATYNRFDALFGSRRTDFGPVSLFGPVSRANVVSGGVRLEAAPSKRFDTILTARGLWLDSPTDSFGATGVRDRAGTSGRHAGQLFEVRGRYWLIPKVARLDATLAYLDKGSFLEDAPNAPDRGDTRYAGVDLTFDF